MYWKAWDGASQFKLVKVSLEDRVHTITHPSLLGFVPNRCVHQTAAGKICSRTSCEMMAGMTHTGNMRNSASLWGMCGTAGCVLWRRRRKTLPAWALYRSIFSAACWARQHIVRCTLHKNRRAAKWKQLPVLLVLPVLLAGGRGMLFVCLVNYKKTAQVIFRRLEKGVRCDTAWWILYSQIWREDFWSAAGYQQRHFHQACHGCLPHPKTQAEAVQ